MWICPSNLKSTI